MKSRLIASSLVVVAIFTFLVSTAAAQVPPPQPFKILPSNPLVTPGQQVLFTANSNLSVFGSVSAITAGGSHTCALLPNGTVECWGLNGDGQLGDGTNTNSTIPVVVNGLTGVTAVSAGGYHTCALLNNGTVSCWGWGGFGQLGYNSKADSYRPVMVTGLSGVTAIASGYEDTCALIGDGSVQCWGNSDNTYYSLVPVPVPGVGGGFVTGAIAIAGAVGQGPQPESGHMCALISDGTAVCWGGNNYGELGHYGYGPFQVQDLNGAISIAAGDGDSCALLSDGTVKCWGWNAWGKLGVAPSSTPNNPPSLPPATATPQLVEGMTGRAIGIATAYGHTCALIEDGTVNCWGSDSSGELGNGITIPAPGATPTPQLVSGLAGATAIVAGGSHSCALLVNGSVQCWGDNASGELGIGSTNNSDLPVTAPILNLAAQGAVRLGIGEYASHTCALLANGNAECWGANGNGQLGLGTAVPGALSTTPVNMTVLNGIKALATGGARTCALTPDGTGWCWGGETVGELGIGNPNPTPAAMKMPQPQNPRLKSISTGGNFTCVLASDGTVWCAGGNESGQLGDTAFSNVNVPVAVRYLGGTVLSDVKALATGEDHACALLADGTVQCWGGNLWGQLGTGVAPADGQSGVPVPAPVLGLTGVTAISAGGQYTCARQDTGKVVCWGMNPSGQLGDGTSIVGESTPPTQVQLSTAAMSITAGRQTACAVAADGTTQCWGSGGAGSLGDGATTDSDAPVQVLSPTGTGPLTGTVSLTIGDHACALSYDGTVHCWGYNHYGELGNGSTVDQSTPVATNPLVTPITWTSSVPGIATIDPATGLATAVSDGATTIGGNNGLFTISTTLTVASPTPVITWPAPAPITYGTPLTSAGQLNATANLPGTFAYTPQAGTVLSAGVQTLSVTFTPTDTAHFTTTSSTVNLSVQPVLPLVTIVGGGFAYDGNPHAATATAGVGNAPIAGTFSYVYTPPGNATVPVAAGNYSVTANFTSSNSNYSNTTATGSISITKAGSSTTITSNTPSASLAGQVVTITFRVAGVTLPTGNVTVTASTSEACTGTLTAGVGSCGITFLSTGTRTLTAVYAGDTNFTGSNSKPSTQSVTGPVATVSPTSINFNTVYAGSITTKTVTLTNSGTTAMTVTGPLLSIVKGGNSNEFVEINLCPKSLAAGKSCTMTVSFIAGAYYTTQTATLNVMDNAPANPQTVTLTALVINPQASFSPTSVNFGTQAVNTSVTKTVTLKNTGTTTLSSIGIAVIGANATDFTSSTTCGSSLTAGSGCTINIAFKPAAKGARSASLRVTDNAQSSTQTLGLSGTGR